MTSPNLAGLKPCPFCGGPAKRITPMGNWRPGGYEPNGVRYVCEAMCDAESPAYGEDAETVAADRWNTRAALRTVSDEPGAGWKLVPVEPTWGLDAMSGAGAEQLPAEGCFGSAGKIACDVYRAMVAEAPAYTSADTQSREGEKP